MTAPVLFIGGMDSSGGAGLLRDTATAHDLQVSYRVAVTAVTAQSDGKVTAIHPVPPDIVAAQIAIAAQDAIGAVKIGMLGNRAIVEAIAGSLPNAPVVLDPVLASSSGHALLDPDGRAAMLELLLPRTSLLTPNLPEFGILARALGHDPAAEEERVIETLFARGCGAVLVKGGHTAQSASSDDRLYHPDGRMNTFTAPRFPVKLRGTGCQLASGIAASLSRGTSLEQAVSHAKMNLTERFAKIAVQA
ncbi:MAG: hydroxymethylpyrimidine/phosphomethylpyrimidine kinase [Paracoccaceae bacterium]|jgi:hydroxymethylpyrimidine/phosphomethylpyrimidine kinase|nr:hydroxymethylpyrimidine/phosphomethylpyrimidine kinase [Paracoccaceae bacterium]